MTIEDMFGDLKKIDILAEKSETKEVLMVLVCNGFIDGSQQTQKLLLDKMEGYLNHTQSEVFQAEYADWSVILRGTFDEEPDQLILALLNKCYPWADDYAVKLEENRCASWSKADPSMKGRIIMTEFPKRARTIRLENGILTFDGEKIIELSELTTEIMEKLAEYKPVGFYVKNNPVTDKLLMPFAGSKNMVNFGVEYGQLTDACFSVFATMPKLRYLLLDGNSQITGSGLSVMGECKIDLLTLNHTGLNDSGLMQAASIPKLTHIQIDHTAVTYEGLLHIAEHARIEPVSKEQFTQEQMETFSNLQREKAKKSVKLDQQAVEECQKILKDFFEAMMVWEKYVSEKGFEDKEVNSSLLNIWEQYVSEKPRLGYRPLALSYSPTGTYSQEVFIDAEQLTKNKIYIYTKTKNTGFERRFLMKRADERWKIDALQERLDGWQRSGL